MEELVNAKKDYLTNCYTRDSLNPFLDKMEVAYRLNHVPFSVFIIDVDHFKFLNDKYGHLCGDEVLKYFASSIRLDLEEEVNAPFRWGGDEFIVVLPGKTAREVRRLAERLKRNIKSRPCLYKGRNIRMGFSGGIANYPEDAKSVNDLLERADQALYFSKQSGRGRVVMYQTMKTKTFVLRGAFVALVCAAFFILYQMRNSVADFFSRQAARLPSFHFHSPFETMQKNTQELFKLQDLIPMPVTNAVPQPATQSAPPPVAPPVVETVDVIHLRSGRSFEGTVVSENDEEVKVKIQFKEGKGILGIKKADILNIEKGVKV